MVHKSLILVAPAQRQTTQHIVESIRLNANAVTIILPALCVLVLLAVSLWVIRWIIIQRRRYNLQALRQQTHLRRSGELGVQLESSDPNVNISPTESSTPTPNGIQPTNSSRRRTSAQQRVVRGFGPPPYLLPRNRHSGNRRNGNVATGPIQPPAIIRIQRHLQSTSGLTLGELDAVAPVTEFPDSFGLPSGDPSNDQRGDNATESQNDKENSTENNQSESVQDDVVCPVCLEDMRSSVPVRKLPCGHFFHASCIQEWSAKANRCPVCTQPVVDPQRLEKSRMAMLNGETVMPLVAESDPNPSRQRRRRTRGENGAFQLRDGSTEQPSNNSPDGVPSDSQLPRADQGQPNVAVTA